MQIFLSHKIIAPNSVATPIIKLMPKIKGSNTAVGTLPELDPPPELDDPADGATAAEPREKVGVAGLLLVKALVGAAVTGAGSPVTAVVGAAAVATELTLGKPVPDGMAMMLDDVALKTVWPIAISLFSRS